MLLTDYDRLEQIRDQAQTLLNQIQDLNKLGMEEFKDLTRIVVEARWSVFPDMQKRLEKIIKHVDEIDKTNEKEEYSI
jgi:hypothetical protein